LYERLERKNISKTVLEKWWLTPYFVTEKWKKYGKYVNCHQFSPKAKH